MKIKFRGRSNPTFYKSADGEMTSLRENRKAVTQGVILATPNDIKGGIQAIRQIPPPRAI
jgi:hypothetical protein